MAARMIRASSRLSVSWNLPSSGTDQEDSHRILGPVISTFMVALFPLLLVFLYMPVSCITAMVTRGISSGTAAATQCRKGRLTAKISHSAISSIRML